MWISKAIVELHHGAISAYSDGLGFGTTFTVELPLLQSIHNRDDCSNNSDADSKNGISAFDNNKYLLVNGRPSCENDTVEDDADTKTPTKDLIRKILVVDDTLSNRKIVCRLLGNEGFSYDEAFDGANCVKLVTATPPSECVYDVILMDFEMPIMNGPAAASALRQLDYNMIIIGVTGNVLSEDRNFFMKHGADAVLHKPLRPSALFDEIEKLYRKKYMKKNVKRSSIHSNHSSSSNSWRNALGMSIRAIPSPRPQSDAIELVDTSMSANKISDAISNEE